MRCKTFLSIVCAYLNNQIYCYGGNQTPNAWPHVESTIYALNLSRTQKLDQLDWTLVTTKNGFDPEKRYQTQFAVLSNGNQLLIEGGEQDIVDLQNIVNDTVIYDALENTWRSIQNNSRLIHTDTGDNGVTVNLPLPSGDTVLFFREIMDSNPFNCFANSFIIAYNVTSKTYGNFTTKMNTPMCVIKKGASAILDSKTNIIYFFGGKNTDSHSQPGYSSFTAGYAFDTKNGIWSQNNYTSNDERFPSPRIHFTTVLAPNSRHIILYGGQNDNGVVSDYLYTLNLDNNTWAHVNLSATDQVLTRAFHSAVLVNTTLFVLFGYQTYGILAPDSIALDVSDVTNIQLLNQYSPSIENTTTQQQPSTTPLPPPLPKSLTVEAKAGIAIGVIIGAATIFGVYFLLYRKRAKRLAQSTHSSSEGRKYKDPDALDWDKIENEHLELKRPPALNQPRPTSSLVQLTPDTATNSTYTVYKTEDISQTPDVRL
ncbi:hypothetical protein RMATCC62417_14321 [Rhizopus microsporus]|nr:hypothetical protein RMATCC62417_14321 [Rhizopus microsporus]